MRQGSKTTTKATKTILRAGWGTLALVAAGIVGCVEQTMTIESTPPGALVYLNDQEVGRTPMTRDFKWYGDYEVQLRLEGYETLSTHQEVIAPAWNWVPLDFFVALWPGPVKDHRKYHYTLKPIDLAKNQPENLLVRAQEMRNSLESSEHTRAPATRPTTQTTKPATQAATRPVTGPAAK